jgi:hypothetical protein
MTTQESALWRSIQELLNLSHSIAPALKVDGVPGGLTQAAITKAITAARIKAAPVKIAETPTSPPAVPVVPVVVVAPTVTLSGIDDRSMGNLTTLNVKVRPMFTAILLEGKRIAKELGAGDYRLISGNRTYAQQNALYAQGRTTSGPIVTNAKGGYSNHNFGIAGDFGVFGTDGKYLDDTNGALAYKVHAAVAKWAKATFPGKAAWGGDWTSFQDTPHFEYKTGLSLTTMRARVANAQDVVD